VFDISYLQSRIIWSGRFFDILCDLHVSNHAEAGCIAYFEKHIAADCNYDNAVDIRIARV